MKWPSYGGLAVAWIETCLVHGEGDWYGQPFRLTTDQKRFLWRWHEYRPGSDRPDRPPEWRYKRGLKGAPKGEGKTEFIAAIGCLEAWGPPQIAPTSPLVVIAAASRDQANELFAVCQIMCGGAKGQEVDGAPLAGLFDVFDTEITRADGRPGRIERVAAVAGTNDGKKPTLFIADEVHEWTGRRRRVHTVIANGIAKRAGARELNLSTAGVGKGDIPPKPADSLLWTMYAEGVMDADGTKPSPRFLFDWRAAADHWDLDRPDQLEAAIREASGAADVLWSVQDRVDRYHDPKVPEHEFRRYFLNQWVDAAEESWLAEHPGIWEQRRDPDLGVPAGAMVTVAVDMSLKHDSTSIVWVWHHPVGRWVVRAKTWTPADSGGRVDHTAVFDWLVNRLAVDQVVRVVVYDPRYFELPARQLVDTHGIDAEEFPQTHERLIPADGHLFARIIDGDIVHDGDPILASHVAAAVPKVTERGWFLSKGASGGRIDAVRALSMALWAAALDAQQPAGVKSPPLDPTAHRTDRPADNIRW